MVFFLQIMFYFNLLSGISKFELGVHFPYQEWQPSVTLRLALHWDLLSPYDPIVSPPAVSTNILFRIRGGGGGWGIKKIPGR